MVDLNKNTSQDGSGHSTRATTPEGTPSSRRCFPVDEEFWQGVVMITLAVGIGLSAVYVNDDGYEEFASFGAWVLGAFGLFRMM